MSDLLKKMHERRLGAWEQAKEIAERAATENRDMTAEERASWDSANNDINAIDARAKDLADGERRAKDSEESFRALLEQPVVRDAPPVGDAQKADLRGWLQGNGGKSFEARAAAPMGTAEFRALSKLTAGAGGNTVKTSFYEKLMAHLIEVSGILSAGPTILNTASGEQIQVPKTTSHSTASLIAEAGTITASDPVFGQVPLDAYKYAFLLQISSELVQDTSVDLEGYVAMQSGRAVGNAFGVHAITGDGSAKPNGLVTAATSGVTGGTAVAGAFTFDNLIDLFFSVIAPYRNSQSCAWMFKDSSLATARKLKDTNGSYLWQPAASVGAPDTIMGKPVYTDPNIAATGLNAKSVLFGDISQYFVRMVDTIRFERSDDYAFNTDLITYRCILRADGDLVDTTGAVKYFAGGAS